jgi:HlyD family secretion protein
VARVDAGVPALLDARARAEAEAAVAGARAVLERARADEQQARAALALAEREAKRGRVLADAGALPVQEAEARESEARLAAEAVSAAASAVRAAAADLARVEVRLQPPSRSGGGIIAVFAPADGTILRRLRESESVVPPGEPLVEIGDPAKLELVADLLSTDVVRVSVGARAIVDQWGGAAPLEATVTRIEPAGFTKISALGVEEQRVNVILALAGQSGEDAVLGDGYRVEVRIVIWEATNVLKVPTSALFREADRWAVYVVEEERARRRFVDIGHQTGTEAEVVSGLDEAMRVIVHPGDLVKDGARVAERANQ